MASAVRESYEGRTHAWDRLPQETDAAWIAFSIFKAQTEPRSKLRVSQQLSGDPSQTKTNGGIGIWARENRWNERVEAFDKYVQDQIDRVEFEDAETKAKAAAAKKESFTEKFAKAAEALLDKGLVLIQFPAVQQTTEDGKTIIKPGNLAVLNTGRKMILDASVLAANLGRIDVAKPDDEDSGDEVPALQIAFEGTVDDSDESTPARIAPNAGNDSPVQEAVLGGGTGSPVREDPSSVRRVN